MNNILMDFVEFLLGLALCLAIIVFIVLMVRLLVF